MHIGDFDRLFDAHADRLFAFLAYRTADRALAEDLAADVFERAMRARKRFDPARGTEAQWLYAIALNLLRDHVRRAVRERAALADHAARDVPAVPSPETAVAQRASVSEAMAVLSDEERETVALRFGADLTAPQIAGLTGEKLTTIEGRLYRALRKLRAELSER